MFIGRFGKFDFVKSFIGRFVFRGGSGQREFLRLKRRRFRMLAQEAEGRALQECNPSAVNLPKVESEKLDGGLAQKASLFALLNFAK